MTMRSINPYDGSVLAEIPEWSEGQIEEALQQAHTAAPAWAATSFGERATLMRGVAQLLRQRRDDLARLITLEMGKLITESRTEIEKCVQACDFYADHAAAFLDDEIIASDAGRSFVAYQPLGTVLAVMPWNFPFWQVFRFAVPGLMAGNIGLLKHASNVPQCARAIESLFMDAGFPEGVFRTMMISAARMARVIADPRVHAVTLTGSEPAGRVVAAQAAANLKKTVLELGGSDAFVVLADADLDAAAHTAVAARFLNAGQSCIAAKRFILVEEIAAGFMTRFTAAVEALMPGDPLDETTTLAPMARIDLRDALHEQVLDSITRGAHAVTGCTMESGPGAFYQASILDAVGPGMPAWEQELFGPVAAVIRVHDEQEALSVANGSRYGLGGSVWTQDSGRGEHFARRMQSGAAFVNGMVKSDPRLPFGGIKCSGYGRELSHHGIHEFVNAQTVWIK